MTLPNPGAIGKAVLITAVALVILKMVKPYAPAAVQNLLP